MSSDRRTQATSIPEEQDVSPSALFYLFQEVSKLASSAHDSFPDKDSPLNQLDEVRRKDLIVVKNEVKDARLIQTSNISCQKNKPHMCKYSQVKEESRDEKALTSLESQCESNNPWTVLGLINLHCEKILYQEEKEFDKRSATKLINSASSFPPAAPDVTESGVRSESVGTEYALGRSFLPPERQQITASRVEDVTDKCTGDSEEDTAVQPEAVGKTHTITTQLLEDTAPTSLQTQHGFMREEDFSVHRQLGRDQEVGKACSSTEQLLLDVPLSSRALLQTHTDSPSCTTQLTVRGNDKALTARCKPAVTLDHNANILPTEPPSDGCPPSPSCVTPLLTLPSPTFSTAGICHSVSKQNDKITASDCTLVPTDGKTAPVSQQRSSVSSSSTPSQKETWEQQDEELGRPSTCQWKTKKPRKQPHPCRSADSHDPDFQGVTFRMDTQLDDTREQCRLCITSKYSKELLKSTRKPKLRTRTSQNFHKTSSSEEESEVKASVFKSKVCASCCTRKTPMWRDAEDGTPLCNACGIRYKKYRVRCVNCWHIPRKEGNSSSHCLKCGNFVKPTSAQRKSTTLETEHRF